jgi:hypothetical protein
MSLVDPKTLAHVNVPAETLDRIQNRLKLAAHDIGVYAKWYLNDVGELLALLRAPARPSEASTLPAPPEDQSEPSTRPEGS